VVKEILLLVICLPVLMGASDPNGLTLREARRLRQEGRYEDAAQAYEAAFELELCDPVLRDALFELATCYQATGLWADAIKTYRVILDDPRLDGRGGQDWVAAQWGFAECLFWTGEYQAAYQAIRAMRGRYP